MSSVLGIENLVPEVLEREMVRVQFCRVRRQEEVRGDARPPGGMLHMPSCLVEDGDGMGNGCDPRTDFVTIQEHGFCRDMGEN